MLKKFYIIIFFVGSAFLLFAAFYSKPSETEQTNKEIIKFSHSKHSELVDCSDCHKTVTESMTLNDRLLPNHDSCCDCHDVDDDNECITCHYDDNYEELIHKKSTLIYNHKIHSVMGMECTNCHKRLHKSI